MIIIRVEERGRSESRSGIRGSGRRRRRSNQGSSSGGGGGCASDGHVSECENTSGTENEKRFGGTE